MQPKRLALLAYLALSSSRSAQSRDRLIAYFWPEAGQDEARSALRQALHHLRQRLGEAAIISGADGRLSLSPSMLLCDAVDLESAAASGDDARVLALYQGEFLDGLYPRDTSPEFEEWMDRTRRHLRTLAAKSAERLANSSRQAGRIDDAISAAARWNEIAPDDEDALRLLLVLSEERGRAGEALSIADRAMRDFESRLGVPPSAETIALVAAIRARRQAEAASGIAFESEAVPGPAVPSVAESLRANTAARESGTAGEAGGALSANATTSAPLPGRDRHLSASWLAVAAVAVVAVFVVVRSRNASAPASGLPPAPSAAVAAASADRLIVTDFSDAGDGLGAVVSAALRVDLAQDSRVRVLTGAQVRNAVRRSLHPDDALIDDSLVRAIAVREGLKAIVAGDVSRVAGTWLLTARLVDVRDGNALASVRETAEDEAGLLPAIERLSRALTSRAYSTLAAQPAPSPLARVTTASLAALREYGEGVRLLDDGERARGLERLQRAVVLDSGFATAWRMLGSTWVGMDEPARAQVALRHAFEHRDRLGFRERYLLEGSYYRNATADYKAAVASYRTLLQVYPQDIAAMNNLALTYVSMRAHVQAESLFKRVIAADSTLVHAYLTLAEQLAMQRRHAEASQVMQEATRRFPGHPVVRLTPIYLAVSAQEWARAESLAIVRLASDVSGLQRVDALQTLARIELLRGRVLRAQSHLAESMTLALSVNSSHRFLSGAVTSAWLALRYRGDGSAARTTLQRALERMPIERVPDADRAVGPLVAVLLASNLNDLAAGVARRALTSGATLSDSAYVQGLMLAAAGNAEQGAALLTRAAAAARDCALCVLPALASARAAAGDLSGAIRAAEDYLSSADIHRFEPDAAELPELLTRLAGWYEQRGQVPLANATWQRLLQLWQDADTTQVSRKADVRRHVATVERR